MKKFWKIILGVGSVLGTILFFFMGKRKAEQEHFEEKVEEKKEEVKQVQEKVSKVKEEKKVVKKKIKDTSKKITDTKSKIKDTSTSKSIIKDFEKKYRKN